MTALRVLLIEDSVTDAKLIVEELRRTGRAVEFDRVDSEETMRAAFEGRTWDLVVSDWSMPKFSAPRALGILREMGKDLPFIIVSGTIGEDMAADAMRAGAHDYVLKDKLGRLVPAVERELREQAGRADRRAAQEALRQSEMRYRRLADSGLVGIVIAESSGRIVEANDTFLGMVGHSREELVQGTLDWGRLTPPGYVRENVAAAEQLKARGAAGPWEKQYIRKDGSHTPALVGVATLEGTRHIAILIDLTERKRADAARRHAEDALRQSERQLRQAQKMEAIGRLAGGVAHDFNNVLSVILSYAELILADKPPGPIAADVDEIRKAASRAAGLTRQLLMFSRQEVVQPKVLDLHVVLTHLDKMLRRILGEDVELVPPARRAMGRVRVDPSHIEQVILNLVVNSRDAMPTGGRLTIETSDVVLDEAGTPTHLGAPPGPYVMLAITDTGSGMDETTRTHLFEPFFTTKERGKGTGLGLSTVFGIVQQSGGAITVRSEPGKGARFEVYFPRVESETNAPVSKPDPTSLRGTETVLIVEDEEQVQTIVLSILRRQGYRAIAAKSPQDALAVCETHAGSIDLLLTDVVMPGMSGPELARKLLVARPKMKVLLMSGYTDDSIARHGVLESGMAFLQKPITPDLLARKLREVLD